MTAIESTEPVAIASPRGVCRFAKKLGFAFEVLGPVALAVAGVEFAGAFCRRLCGASRGDSGRSVWNNHHATTGVTLAGLSSHFRPGREFLSALTMKSEAHPILRPSSDVMSVRVLQSPNLHRLRHHHSPHRHILRLHHLHHLHLRLHHPTHRLCSLWTRQ